MTIAVSGSILSPVDEFIRGVDLYFFGFFSTQFSHSVPSECFTAVNTLQMKLHCTLTLFSSDPVDSFPKYFSRSFLISPQGARS